MINDDVGMFIASLPVCHEKPVSIKVEQAVIKSHKAQFLHQSYLSRTENLQRYGAPAIFLRTADLCVRTKMPVTD